MKSKSGGNAVNIAYSLSLLTSRKIIVLGAVGRDGDQIIDFLKSTGVDISGILKDNKLYTSTGRVITDMKDNQIWGFYYGAAVAAKNVDLKSHISGHSLVVLSPNHRDAFIKVLDDAIELKVDYIFDPGMTLTWIKDNDLIRGVVGCRFLVGNDYEISAVLKRTRLRKDELLNKKISIITTLGEQGVMYEDKAFQIKIPGYKVRKIVDPTGAGDAWRAGFIGALVEGEDVRQALKYGNILASFAVEHYGTVNHRPQKSEIIDRIRRL